jgi:hypothetical protein
MVYLVWKFNGRPLAIKASEKNSMLSVEWPRKKMPDCENGEGLAAQ